MNPICLERVHKRRAPQKSLDTLALLETVAREKMLSQRMYRTVSVRYAGIATAGFEVQNCVRASSTHGLCVDLQIPSFVMLQVQSQLLSETTRNHIYHI